MKSLIIILCIYVFYKVGTHLFPTLIKWSIKRRYFAEINWRSSHATAIPTTGGLIFFIALIIPLILADDWFNLLASLLGYLALCVGWLDDRLDVKWYFKLGTQLGIGLIFCFVGFNIENLRGILGLYQLSTIASYCLTTLVVMAIINAINLFDGVDGLAGILALSLFSFFGVWFFFSGQLYWGSYALSITGLLIAFLKYNFSPAKIFLGDTGSLFLGTNIGLFLLVFIQGASNDVFLAPIALLSIPIIDMTRLFVLRILRRKSPFSADKSHFHHLLIEAGVGHREIAYAGLVMSLLLAITSSLFLLFFSLNTSLLLMLSLSALGYVWIQYQQFRHNVLKIKESIDVCSKIKSDNNLLKSINYEN